MLLRDPVLLQVQTAYWVFVVVGDRRGLDPESSKAFRRLSRELAEIVYDYS